MLKSVERLKLELMAEGIDVSIEARESIMGPGMLKPLTLADYASTSGIGLRLEDNIWVNAPISEYNPNFVTRPRHRLLYENGGFLVTSGKLQVKAQPVPVPAYHQLTNRWGHKYTSYAITHTDRVRISPVEGCALTCQFCDSPYEYSYRKKSIEGLIDSVAVALSDPVLPARHVMISGGTPRAEDYHYENEVYQHVCAAFPDVDVDVMMIPVPGLLDPQTLLDFGVNELAINLELYNEEYSRRCMTGKWKIGRDSILDFIGKVVDKFGSKRVRSLLLVGLEPVEDTLRGVEALAQRGCEPVLSPFRPDPATPLRHLRPPGAEVLAEVYERSAELTSRLGVRLGPKCIPCQHNTLTFPDDSGYYV